MTLKFQIKSLVVADSNVESGLYHFVATLSDNTQCRLIYSKNPDWKIIGVNRLLNVPCPICRKDYYCNCMGKYANEFEQEIIDKGLISI
ncbi:hypothetical protein KZ483_16645 [Paenibacillus sp. sptzw28]|uniref:hypothetical protein n=1 Tax=Paenibacillus sp. sptzw28 TaxID=715179 RepID=UPI001C6DDC16|nr:hypothetical protein [Paenibacillus sp. sptzw28]QYR19537.1 hypothetical protein KZ483_16645 [Paenibacillus sp. sptzw28]